MTGTPQTTLAWHVGEDRPFQMRFWIFQRIMWLVFALIMLAALIGWTGEGGAFAEKKTQAGSASVTHMRVVRYRGPTKLLLEFSEPTSRSTEFSFDRRFAEFFEVETITPEPSATLLDEGRITYIFKQTQPAPARIELVIKPDRIGLLQDFAIRFGDGTRTDLDFIILP